MYAIRDKRRTVSEADFLKAVGKVVKSQSQWSALSTYAHFN